MGEVKKFRLTKTDNQTEDKIYIPSNEPFIMKKLIFPVLILLVFYSCKKSSDNIIWEKSFGPGTAMFVKATDDSGIVSCGETGGKQYFLHLDKNRNKVFEYKSSENGLLSSAWCNDSCFIAAGSTGGQMLLIRLDNAGNKLKDTIISTTFDINRTSISYLGNGELLAVGSANPDPSGSVEAGLCFVWFDTTCTVSNRIEIKETTFIAASDIVTDNAGNIYVAITRKSAIAGAKPRAGIAKFNNLAQKLWETELYNNPDFGAASLDIEIDNYYNIYVSGKAELPVSSGTANNSFIASLSGSGLVRWKKYLEYANSGSSVKLDDSGQPVVLNKNCFIINILNPDDGSSAAIIRTYSVCDSNNTDAFGLCIDLDRDGNILMAGSKGNGFYLAVKSPQAQSPV